MSDMIELGGNRALLARQFSLLGKSPVSDKLN